MARAAPEKRMRKLVKVPTSRLSLCSWTCGNEPRVVTPLLRAFHPRFHHSHLAPDSTVQHSDRSRARRNALQLT